MLARNTQQIEHFNIKPEETIKVWLWNECWIFIICELKNWNNISKIWTKVQHIYNNYFYRKQEHITLEENWLHGQCLQKFFYGNTELVKSMVTFSKQVCKKRSLRDTEETLSSSRFISEGLLGFRIYFKLYLFQPN